MDALAKEFFYSLDMKNNGRVILLSKILRSAYELMHWNSITTKA